MKKLLFLPFIITSISLSNNYCSKSLMNNIEFASPKIDKRNLKLQNYYTFPGVKHINKQIAKSTYLYNNYNFYDENYASRWIELTNSYIEDEEKHLGIPIDLSHSSLYFDTLLNIGLFARYQKMDIKKTYLTLFKKQEFFSDFFQKPTIYKYMIMKNLDVATEADLNRYFKKLKDTVYRDNKSKEYYFAKRYYFAFFTSENLGDVYNKFSSMENRNYYLNKILGTCSSRDRLIKERGKFLNKNELIDLFYASIVYPEIQPTIEEYFYGLGLPKLWGFWNYEYNKLRNNRVKAAHYMTVFYKKSEENSKPLVYFDYIESQVKASKELIQNGKSFDAYKISLNVIRSLSSKKEGVEDYFFPLINQAKEIINDSSTAILNHFSKSGDVKTYNRILEERNIHVLHIIKRKY